MTLQNLKEALYQNNVILLSKMKSLKDSIEEIKKGTGSDITEEEIQQAIIDILQMLDDNEEP